MFLNDLIKDIILIINNKMGANEKSIKVYCLHIFIAI